MSVSLRRTPALLDVLHALAQEDVWGLKIVQDSGRPAGSVYPILSRLEAAGYVSSEWESEPGTDSARHSGPRRRYYRLTVAGAAFATASRQDARAVQKTTRPRFAPGVRLA